MEKIQWTKYGITGLLTITLISLIVMSLAGAVQLSETYNPFTREPDYYTTSNFTGDNITADYFFGGYFVGNGSLLTDLPSGGNLSFNQTLTDSLYVPYTGAISSVDLNSKNFTNFKNLQATGGVASGSSATAFSYATASGASSFAQGFLSSASGSGAVVLGGSSNVASGTSSLAFGTETIASNTYSIAMGYKSISSGYSSFASGISSNASGLGSTAMGYSKAIGSYSTAFGWNSTATNSYSTAIGKNVLCSQDNAVCISGNVSIGGSNPTAKLEVIGDANITGDTNLEGDLIIGTDGDVSGQRVNIGTETQVYQLNIVDENGGARGIYIGQHNDAKAAPLFLTKKSRGTEAIPSNAEIGDFGFSLFGSEYFNGAYHITTGICNEMENNDSSYPFAKLTFSTSQNGITSCSSDIKMTLDSSGDLHLDSGTARSTFYIVDGETAGAGMQIQKSNSALWALNKISGSDDFNIYNYATSKRSMRIYSATDLVEFAGNVNATKNLNVVGNITGNHFYGEMYFYNDSGISISLNQTFQQLSSFEESPHLNGFVFHNSGESKLEARNAGTYQVMWNARGDGTLNHIYEGIIFVNDIQQNNTFGRVEGSALNVVTLDGFGFINLNTGDNVSIYIRDTSGTTSGTAYMGNLNLMRVGD